MPPSSLKRPSHRRDGASTIDLNIAPSINRLKSVMNRNVHTADDAIVRTGLHVGITELNMLCVKQ